MTRTILSTIAWYLFACVYVCSPALAEPGEDEPVRSVRQIEKAIQRNIERVRAEEGRDDPVSSKNEVVMSPGMKITATTPAGTITITAGKGLKRSYTWEGATRSVQMWPRKERWYGSLGLYFPGSGDHWKEHNGITRCVVEEGQRHFKTLDEAQSWIDSLKARRYVYRNDGLMVDWEKVLPRNQLDVEVWQLYVDGKKPTKLRGSQDDKIVVEESKDTSEQSGGVKPSRSPDQE